MKQGKIVAIIQARMGSTRLPGKVLREVGGKPILEILIKRLRRSRRIDSILVATTEKAEDNGIVDLATKVGVEWYRGSEDDVLKRFIDASRAVNADIVIRVTADNPLTDPELIRKNCPQKYQRLLESFLAHEALCNAHECIAQGNFSTARRLFENYPLMKFRRTEYLKLRYKLMFPGTVPWIRAMRRTLFRLNKTVKNGQLSHQV